MTLNKILRYILLVGIFLVTIVPLFVASSMYFPFITGKNFAFRIIVELMFGVWLVLIYRDKESRPKKSWILISLTAYLLIATLATIFGENPARSFWSNFERMEGLVAYLHSYLFFLITISVMKGRKIWHWLLNMTVGVSAVTSVYGLMQLLGKAEIHQGASRLDASLGNAAYLAVYLLFHIFILGYLFFSTSAKNKISRYFYGFLLLFESVILYYTATRGAILGLLGGVFLLLLLLIWKGTGSARKTASIFWGILVLGVISFWFLRTTPFIAQNPVLGRFASISLTETTTQSRFLIWNMSLQGFKEHPILGWGPENYPLVFQKYYAPEMWKQEPWFDRSHNVIFDNLINFGLLGLLAYLSIFVTAIYYLWRKRENEDQTHWLGRLIFTGLLAAYFFQNIFVFDNLTSIILFYIVLGYIHSVYGQERDSSAELATNKKKSSDNEKEAFLPIVIILAITASAFSVYYFSWRSIDISKTLIRSMSQNSPELRLADFNHIFSYGQAVGKTEAREQLFNISYSVIVSKDIPNDLKEKYFLLTKAEAEKYLSTSPDDARFRLLYGSFLANLGQFDSAISELKIANQLSPKKQMIMFELGSTLLNAGKIPEAVVLFKQAFEEDETYDEARKLYALVSLYLKDTNMAKKLLGADPDRYIKDDSRFDSFRASLRTN